MILFRTKEIIRKIEHAFRGPGINILATMETEVVLIHSAYKIVEMVKKRFLLMFTVLKLITTQNIVEKLKNIDSNQFGYNAFGLSDVEIKNLITF